MNLTTAVLITKGLCLTWIPVGTALVAGLPELGVPVLFGMPYKFWSLLIGASVAGASGMLAFLSTTFGTFLQKRSTDATVKP